MSLRTEGLLLHTFCGIWGSFQVISGHCARSGQRSGQGVVAVEQKLKAVRRTSRGRALLRVIVCR